MAQRHGVRIAVREITVWGAGRSGLTHPGRTCRRMSVRASIRDWTLRRTTRL
jgi:hypothetical protein